MTGERRNAPAGWAIVVPTVGRPSLHRLLDALARQGVGLENGRLATTPVEVVVVDDRPGDVDPLRLERTASVPWTVRIVRSHGRGPAAARNRGWQAASSASRACRVTWIVFLDDDVVTPDGWMQRLVDDLANAGPRVGGVQGRIRVPRPDRRPTDWERNTAALESAAWATADMAYRLDALESVDGFDERFPRAYREDADLAMRVRRHGWCLERGSRSVVHPVRAADDLVSVRVQAGNADDALMRRLHGPEWRDEGEIGRGALRLHLSTVALVGVGVSALVSAGVGGLARSGSTIRSSLVVAALGAAGAAGFMLRFYRHRMRGGPRPGDAGFGAESRRMVATSALIPFAAVWHRLLGEWRHRRAGPWPTVPRAVLFDRDGTLVHDEPYNGDPGRVAPVDGARASIERLREAGLLLGVITNQSGIGRGLISREQAVAVNARIDALVGPFDTWHLCPHAPDDGCACRKPSPGLVLAAASSLGVRPEQCVVIGDIGADVEAARSAGARAILVPTDVTRVAEIDAAPELAATLPAAVDLVLACRSSRARSEQVVR